MSTPREPFDDSHSAHEEPINIPTGKVTEDASEGTGRTYVDRDEQAFRNFYQQHLGAVYRYIYTKVGNREEAEDLTTQVFLKVIHHLDYERDALSIQKWLFQVARTTIADYWRVRYRTPATSLEVLLDAGWEGPVQENVEPAEQLARTSTERVQLILCALPEHHREVLTCRFLLNLSIKETALKLGLTETNVKVLQFRALKRAATLEPHVSGTTVRPNHAASPLNSNSIPPERDYAK